MQTSSFPFSTVGIAGLGLIGATLAKAVRINTGCTVFADDIDDSVLYRAEDDGLISGRLVNERIGECDLFLLALYPGDAVSWLRRHAPAIRKGAVVVDCCGVKGVVCAPLEALAREKGFTFIGCHPMAGLHMSGFAYAAADLFKKASFVMCPADDVPYGKVKLISELFRSLGFSNIQMSTPEEHDLIIAYTSQLCHIVSNCFVKNEAASIHAGFSAGSYRDLTRVAKLNEQMWTELFFDNRGNLLAQLDEYLANLTEYRDALAADDRERVRALLREGRLRKEAIDGDSYRN